MSQYQVAVSTSSFGKAGPEPLEMLKAANVELKLNPHGRTLTESEALQHLQGTHGLIAGVEPLNQSVLNTLPAEFKVISRVGVGLSSIDLPAAQAKGIHVFNTPNAPAYAVAEYTVATILNITRGLIPHHLSLKSRAWKKQLFPGLQNAHVLIIGFGRIGHKVAEMLALFECNILAYDPFLAADRKAKLNPRIQWVESLQQGLQQANVITLHAESPNSILNDDNVSFIQPNTYLINNSRGILVQESTLLAALSNNQIAAAWLDTFEGEPYTGPLLDHENVFVSPHISSFTPHCRLQMEIEAVQNLLSILN